MLAPAGVEVRSATDPSALAEAGWVAVVERAGGDDPSRPVETQGAGHPLVLVIEDNPAMNRFVRDALADRYRVEAAFDGREGIAKALALRPDLILTDVMMPGLSGDRLVLEGRRHRELDETPIVVLTAKADDDSRVRLLRSGANDYLTKPFSIEELRVRVGNLIGAKLALNTNRTLYKEVQEKNVNLERLTGELQVANRELEAFNYSASHDLQGPLRIIDGFSQALLEDQHGALDETGRRHLTTIRSMAQRMRLLIHGLLELSRITRSELTYGRVDLTALAKEIVEELRATDPGRSVEAAIQEGLVAEGDEQLLRIALDNLLGNAWKYTARAEPAMIELGAERERDEVRYFVRDNGVGFNMAYADHLFEPFQRLHSDAEFDGTGIGLATVKRIVQRHRGRVGRGQRGGGRRVLLRPPVRVRLSRGRG